MIKSDVQTVLERIHAAESPDRADVEAILRITDPAELDLLFRFADAVRRRFVGNGVLLRGIIEFSNICHNTCQYCGLNRHNTGLERYRLPGEEILAVARDIRAAGVKTVVLQSGEEHDRDAEWLGEIIGQIKSSLDVAVTLSVGERTRQEYEIWRQAGADRYLLKIETSDARFYRRFHPGMSLENRIRCLRDLAELGYQVGSGCLVGLKGQTVGHLAGDIEFFREGDFDMISVSPFIPHPQTSVAAERAGDLAMTLKMIALTRIVSRNAHIPASTAIGSLHGRDERPKALAAGANVVMPNFTPGRVRRLYDIYPGKTGPDPSPQASMAGIERMVAAMGLHVDGSRGDSLKPHAALAKAQRN